MIASTTSKLMSRMPAVLISEVMSSDCLYLRILAAFLITCPSLTEATLRSSASKAGQVYSTQNSLYSSHGSADSDLSREKREDGGSGVVSTSEANMEGTPSFENGNAYGYPADSDVVMNGTDLFLYHHNHLNDPEIRQAPEWHVEGPMPTISDSLFSLIILVYVSVIFVFMFFSFCWKEPDPPLPDPAHKNIPMITSMLEEMEKQEQENKKQAEAEEAAAAEAEEKAAKLSNGNSSTEMVEMKPVSTTAAAAVTAPSNGNSEGNIRKDADTIIVNVITEKSKGSASTIVKEEQV